VPPLIGLYQGKTVLLRPSEAVEMINDYFRTRTW